MATARHLLLILIRGPGYPFFVLGLLLFTQPTVLLGSYFSKQNYTK